MKEIKEKQSLAQEKIDEITKKLENKFPILCKKTEFCRHKCGCIQHIILGTIRGFILGYTLKTALNFIGLLLKIKKIKKKCN